MQKSEGLKATRKFKQESQHDNILQQVFSVNFVLWLANSNQNANTVNSAFFQDAVNITGFWKVFLNKTFQENFM